MATATTASAASSNFMFSGTKVPRNLTQYKLMQGVTDFGQLAQWNLYESGYSFLKVVSVPEFLLKLAEKSDDNGTGFSYLLNNYKHILEYEFRGLDGIEDLTTETFELTDGISNINVISKAVMQSASQISMRFFEKSGSTITKLHEAFITGIKDPRTMIKTYHGLIESGDLEAGYENEVFSFLYFVTDNTVTNIEKAFLFLNAQPTKADWSIYNSEKGQVEQKEITVEFNVFPVTGKIIYEKAAEVLAAMNNVNSPAYIIKSYDNFTYTGTEKINPDETSVNIDTLSSSSKTMY